MPVSCHRIERELGHTWKKTLSRKAAEGAKINPDPVLFPWGVFFGGFLRDNLETTSTVFAKPAKAQRNPGQKKRYLKHHLFFLFFFAFFFRFCDDTQPRASAQPVRRITRRRWKNNLAALTHVEVRIDSSRFRRVGPARDLVSPAGSFLQRHEKLPESMNGLQPWPDPPKCADARGAGHPLFWLARKTHAPIIFLPIYRPPPLAWK